MRHRIPASGILRRMSSKAVANSWISIDLGNGSSRVAPHQLLFWLSARCKRTLIAIIGQGHCLQASMTKDWRQ
jgi:hypothetical protein